MNFVVIDTEKLNDDPLSLCEIGMVKYVNGIPTDEFHSYIKPRIELKRNPFAYKYLRHITDDILNSSNDFAVVYGKMKEFIDNNILVCHNKGADLNLLYYNEKEYGISGLYTYYLDTMDIDSRSIKDMYKAFFNKELSDHHHALEDAKHTAEIFGYIVKTRNIDTKQFIKTDYIPQKEINRTARSIFKRVTLDGLVIEDDLLEDFDFSDKVCVISGESKYRDVLKEKLERFCKKVTSSLSGSTNVLIVGNDVGPKKKEKAKSLKLEKPKMFYVFKQESVAAKLHLLD